ncbi:hypothetical protein Acr_17g0010210 [Actinidia rufa]|uniref:Uncharacterized protein n=1 Tax=Actinidia rufa TaxID=165716 RepID=A0A7J0G3V2_9ERIC|nr:hypothetical protein Acr_17g0010210 [Actinidia rufa]
MPNGDNIANVGDLMEMESQGHLIVRVMGEMDPIGDVRTHGEYSKKSELNEFMSGNVEVGDLENTVPSWISDHLRERSHMTTEVTQYPSSLREDPSDNEGSPLVDNDESPSVDTRPSSERETNIMTQGKLDRLRKSSSIPSRIQIRLSDADETITSTRLGDGAFYEATFQAGEAEENPAMRYPSNVNGWKNKFFFISTDNWEFAHGKSQGLGVLRVLRSWSTPSQRCNVLPALTEIEQQRFDQISNTPERGQFYPIKDVLRSKSFLRSFALNFKKMASNGGSNA